MSVSEVRWGYILMPPNSVEEAEPVDGSGMGAVTENSDHGDRRKEVGEMSDQQPGPRTGHVRGR